jgi:hypothetical protein
MTAIPTYRDAHGKVAQFLPGGGMPGITHQVVVNRRKAGWLAEGHLATAKAAAFFIRQVAEKEGEAGMAARRTEAASAMRPSAENSRRRALLSQSIARVVARIRQKQDTRRYGAEEILAEAVGDLEAALALPAPAAPATAARHLTYADDFDPEEPARIRR